MPLSRSRETLTVPGVNTNLGEEINKQRESQRATSEFNKELVRTGTSFDPTKQAVDKAGYTAAMDEYREWLKGADQRIKDATSISIDKKSGKITVKAPDLVLRSPMVKENYDNTLKMLSQAYKVDKDQKFALLKDSDEKKTVEEWLKDLEDNLKADAPKYMVREQSKDYYQAKDGVKLNDEQITKIGTVAVEYNDENGNKIKVSNNTLQVIPESLMTLPVFKNLKGYDKEKHTVRWEDLSEVWNRDNTSDEDILELHKAVEKYFSDKDFSDADEYAEMTALATFLSQKDPSVNFWRGTAEVLGESILGVITGAATFDVGVFSAAEGLMNWLQNMGETIFAWERGNDWGEAWEASKKDDATFVRDYLAPELETWIGSRHQNTLKLNDAAAAGQTITNTLVPVAMQIATTVAAGNAAAQAASGVVGRVVSSIALKYGETAQSMGMLTAANIASGAISAEQIAKGVYIGTEIMLKLSDATVAAQAAVNAISAVKAVTYAAASFAKIADIAAQAIVDITLSDPKLFRQLLETDDPEAKAYAMEQLAMNTVGEITGVMAGKAIKGFAKTDVGRVLNAKWGTRIAALKASIGQTADNIRINVFHGGNADWLVEKVAKRSADAESLSGTWLGRWANNRASKAERQLRNYAERRVARAANIKAGELAKEIGGGSWDEIMTSAKDVQKRMRKIISEANVNVIGAMYNQDVSSEVAKIIQDDSVLRSMRDGYLEKLTNVIKAEDAEGLGKGARKIKISADDVGKSGSLKSQTVRVLDKETNEYIEALYRTRVVQAEIALSDVAENVRRAEEELPHLQAIIESFEANHSTELVSAAKALDRQGVKFSEAIQEARVRLGVMSEDTLNGLRASGYFDEGYRRQQRLRSWNKYKKEGGQLKISDIREMQHLGWGDTSAWQDVSITMFDDLNELARQSVRKRAVDTLKGLGFDIKTVVDENGTRIIEEASQIRKKATSTINNNAKTFVRNMDDSIFNEVFDFKKKGQVVRNQEALTIASGARVAGAKAKDAVASVRERIAFVNDLAPEQLDELLDGIGNTPFQTGMWQADDFEAFETSLGKRGKAYLREKMDGQVGYLYDAPVSARDEALARVEEIKANGGYSAASWRAATGKDVPGWAKNVVSGRGGMEIRDLTEIDELRELLRETRQKRVVGTIYNAENFQRLIQNDPDVLDELKRIYATTNKDVYNNEKVVEAASAIKKQKNIFDAETRFLNNSRRLEEIADKYNLPSIEQRVINSVDELIETAIDNNAADETVYAALSALGDATAGSDDLLEYTTIKSMFDNRKTIEKDFKRKAIKSFNEQITADISVKYANDPQGYRKARENVSKIAKKYADEATELFDERLTQRLDEITGRLADQGSDIIDKHDYFAKVDELNKQITEAAANPNVVKTYGAHGYEEFVEMSPTVASMFTNMPRPLQHGPFGVIQNAFVRTFRFGTTGGYIPGSLVNQAFRDTGNAIIAGDAWRTNAAVKRVLSEQFGETVAEYMQKEMPDVYDAILAKADETGKTAGEVFAERELARGKFNVGAELESNLYQLGRENRIKRTAEGVYERNVWDKIQDALDTAQRKADYFNNVRETYLRQRVYSNNLAEAIDTGMSLDEARTFAQFMQQEATTNFSRQSYHLANMTQTVPYLGAAINGTKSFWRLFSLDPVGVTTRIVGGLVVPTIALTAYSLADEDNRRIYEQIPEYEKEDHITFVVDKQIITIPIPQEISNLVTPIQHMVEKMHGANDNSFAELMANDLLGAFPVELNGFVNIDADRILEGNLLSDHLIPGFAKMSSSLMPPLVKSGFMMATGIDPYTNKKIDTSRRGVDPETGEPTVYDYQSGFIASRLGRMFNGNLMSAQMAQKVLQSLFGTGGMTFLDALGDVVEAVVDDDESTTFGGGASKGLQRLAENATSKVTSKLYGEESNLAWTRAVRTLESRKDAMLNDKNYQLDVEALSNKDLSEDARKKIESRVRTRQQEYYNEVLGAVNNLINEYDGTFDRYKMLTVISLMNLDKDQTNELPYNKYATYLSEEEVDLNTAAAVETMAEMGFPSVNDWSLFGYYYKGDDGRVTIKYNSPLAILNYKKSSWQQSNIEEAEIRGALDEAGITRKEMFGDDYDKAKAAGKKALKQYKSEWNKKVVKVLAPYIKERGVKAFFNSAANRSLLGGDSGYIFVDNKYKTKEYLLEIFGEKE